MQRLVNLTVKVNGLPINWIWVGLVDRDESLDRMSARAMCLSDRKLPPVLRRLRGAELTWTVIFDGFWPADDVDGLTLGWR